MLHFGILYIEILTQLKFALFCDCLEIACQTKEKMASFCSRSSFLGNYQKHNLLFCNRILDFLDLDWVSILVKNTFIRSDLSLAIIDPVVFASLCSYNGLERVCSTFLCLDANSYHVLL
ncbi:hypothetical protein NEHOM01_2320 [Nematocida homosporus]|uniref:uncharacterized protein n=1 Tax=Nematocida homosporus TaxID=1912981 RepID=UPI00222005A8|nr:uncharacterized protein NEHOM01_2320 [Nematocida homosporus]KAI5187720.1 hypothetical protein NEHOM01_2320 [Nematocida homosporus]